MKDFKAILSEHLTREHSEKRYVIVDKEGNVLDSNDNQGYLTENKAIVAYSNKKGIPTKKAIEKIVDKAYKQARKLQKKG